MGWPVHLRSTTDLTVHGCSGMVVMVISCIEFTSCRRSPIGHRAVIR